MPVLAVDRLPVAPVPPEAQMPFHTLTEDFTFQFHYKLIKLTDGISRIIIKSHDQIHPKTIIGGDIVDCSPGWHYFDRTGLPYWHFKKKLLHKDEQLVAISVSSEVLIALTNKLDILIYKPTDKKRPTVWKRMIGQPFRTSLKIPSDFRGFAFSVSIGKNLKKQLAQIDEREITVYYEDADGERHGSGFCAGIYGVSSCGRIIYLWDTGLKAGSFSIGLLSPLNGMTQIQSISVAGSTIFVSVLDEQDKLRFFTRHYDYEGNGSAPGFSFEIVNGGINSTQNKKFSQIKEENGRIHLGYGTRHLPDDVWYEQDTNDIEKFIKAKVSIHLIGQGEKERELRVLAVQEGRPGFFHRKIYDKLWNFYKLGNKINLLYFSRVNYSYKYLQPLQKNYDGCMNINGINIKVRLLKFHCFNTTAEPSIIELSYGAEIIRLKLHSRDAWSVHYLPPGYESLVANFAGSAKLLIATLVIPDSELEYIYSNSRSFLSYIVKTYFMPYNNQSRALRITADNQVVKIKSSDENLGLVFARDLSIEEIRNSYYMRKVLGSGIYNITPSDKSHCLDLIKQCNNLISEIKQEHFKIAEKHLWFYCCYKVASAGRKIVGPLSRLYFKIDKRERLLPVKDMGAQALEDVKYLFRDNASICLDVALNRAYGYQQAIDILETRIIALKSFLVVLPEELEGYYSHRYIFK